MYNFKIYLKYYKLIFKIIIFLFLNTYNKNNFEGVSWKVFYDMKTRLRETYNKLKHLEYKVIILVEISVLEC